MTTTATRRDTLRIAAIAAAAAAAQAPLTAAQADALPASVELVAPMRPNPYETVRGPDSFIAVRRRLDWLLAFGDECCQDEQDNYKAALGRVIALDRALLDGGAQHPVSVMDEAVFAWALSLWHEGVTRGAAAATGLLLAPGVDFIPPAGYTRRPYAIYTDIIAGR